MSIDLVIKGKNDNDYVSLCICASEAHTKYWIPLAKKLDLDLIKEMKFLHVDQKNYIPLIDQLKSLHNWLENNCDGSCCRSKILKVTNEIIESLLRHNPSDFDIFIG